GAKLDSLTGDILSFGDILKNRDYQQEKTFVQESLYGLPLIKSPLAARGASQQESTGLSNRSIQAGSVPVPRRAQALSKAEAYNAVFGDIKSKKGQERFRAFDAFCEEDHIADSTTWLEFLRFLNQQIEAPAS